MHNVTTHWRTRVWMTALLSIGWAAATARGQLQLDPPAVPEAFVREQIAALEDQIAARQRAVDPNDRARSTVLAAQRNLRLVVRQLWRVAEDEGIGEGGALPALYAMTLDRHIGAFDALAERLPEEVGEALRVPEPDDQHIARLARVVDAIKTFNQRVDEELTNLESGEAEALDAYLRRVLSSWSVAVTASGRGPIVPAWPAAGAGGPPRFGSKALDALAARLDDTPVDQATRNELKWLIDMMRRGLSATDLHPQITSMAGQVQRILNLAAAFDGADWLDEALDKPVDEQLHSAALLLKDPRTRDAAETRLDELERLQRVAEVVTELSNHQDVPMDPFRRAVGVIDRLYRSDQTVGQAMALADVVEQLGRTVVQRRAAAAPKLSLDIRRVRQVLERRYASTEFQLLDNLPRLLDDPTAATSPQWTEPLAQLASLHAQVSRLDEIPQWVRAMSRFNPRASAGLYQQAKLIAEDMLNPATHAGASAALTEMHRQLELFEQLPHENELGDPQAPMRRFAGEHHEVIAQQIVVLRSQWSAAWSAGADPTLAGSRLLLVRRLLETMHDAGSTLGDEQTLSHMNRWAAWELNDGAMGLINGDAPAMLRQAAQLAADAQWDRLARTLDELDRRASLVRLTAAIDRRIGPAVEGLPEGLAAGLGQCLYEPGPDAFAADQRADLARVCVYLTVAEHAQRDGDRQRAAAFLDQAGAMGRRIIQALEGAATVPTGDAGNTVLDAIDL